jgi:hypothetical protein
MKLLAVDQRQRSSKDLRTGQAKGRISCSLLPPCEASIERALKGYPSPQLGCFCSNWRYKAPRRPKNNKTPTGMEQYSRRLLPPPTSSLSGPTSSLSLDRNEQERHLPSLSLSLSLSTRYLCSLLPLDLYWCDVCLDVLKIGGYDLSYQPNKQPLTPY